MSPAVTRTTIRASSTARAVTGSGTPKWRYSRLATAPPEPAVQRHSDGQHQHQGGHQVDNHAFTIIVR
jgi:hypothetical protein